MTKKILVVDDSPSVRHMIERTLLNAGYTVATASDGRDALTQAMAFRPDAVLTDQNMPNLDGLGFCQAFRASAVHAGVPVIFLSTDSSPDLKQRARDAGALGWLVKPFDAPKLLGVMAKVVGS
ncbi:response regulator [Loktanella sp. DJP18]|uniref:response regulator n=1 Tax=Loktanella sp. DJP18 TaxID=3409788 RepID=UPI003BB7D2C1